MTMPRSIAALAVSVAILAAACWFVTGAFPLSAAPQTVNDMPGVVVELNGAPLLHRPPVMYPADLRSRGVQGTVVLQVKTDSKGEVADVTVLSGPEELRRGAIQSVLQWHFAKEAANGTRQISIAFPAPKDGMPVPPALLAAPMPVVTQGVRSGVMEGVIGSPTAIMTRQAGEPGVVRKIVVNGLSDLARQDLLASLPVHEGDRVSVSDLGNIRAAVSQFDPHLTVRVARMGENESQLVISAPGAPLNAAPVPVPGAIRVGSAVQQAMLLEQTHPEYPELAKQARIQGTVTLNATIGKDGHVQQLSVASGHPLLSQAAIDAVKNWVYKPTLLNGQPVAVVTTIEVNFTLSQ